MLEFFWKCQMAYNYPLNNPGGVHETVCDFTHLSPPPTFTVFVGPIRAKFRILSFCQKQCPQTLCCLYTLYMNFYHPVQALCPLWTRQKPKSHHIFHITYVAASKLSFQIFISSIWFCHNFIITIKTFSTVTPPI